MKGIGAFFEKFKNLALKDEAKKEAVADAIYKIINQKIEIKNNAFFLTLDDFGPEGSEKVILILNHFSPPQKSQDTENIPSPSVTATFSIGDPPVLSSVHVVQDGKDIYKAEFAAKGAEKRELLITKDEILDLKKSAGLGEIHLKFSKILEKAPRIFLEEFEIENFKSSDGGKAWQAQINLDALKKSLKEHTLIQDMKTVATTSWF